MRDGVGILGQIVHVYPILISSMLAGNGSGINHGVFTTKYPLIPYWDLKIIWVLGQIERLNIFEVNTLLVVLNM